MDPESLSGEASLKSPSPTKCQVKRELLIMHVATCGSIHVSKNASSIINSL